ncbi:MAG: ATP-dependent RNA/DNA helicase IGHMBP2, partial [Myxococcota bacterium]
MTPHDRLRGLVTLWRRELSASEARAREERSNASLSDRVEQGVALRNLEVIDRDAAAGNRTKLWLACSDPRAFDVTQIGPGSPVRLWWDSPDSADAVRATVGQRRSDRLSVLVDGAVPDRLEEGRFQLDRDAPQTTFRRGDRALKSFLDAPSNSPRGRLREILFGATAVEPGRDIEWAPLDQQLNAAQLRAVERAMTAPDVALIHGPPGTGKTRTLVEVIRQAAASGQRVLAAAASNTAVDNLAERLVAAGVDVVRLGHPARVSESIEERTLDAILERSGEAALARRWVAEANAIRRKVRMRSGRGTLDYAAKRELLGDARRLMGDARHHLKRVRRARVAAASVVCATAAGSDSQVLADTRFDLVVLDEATQAADPIALVALGRGDRVVLAGDPCQLPPTVIDRQAERGGLGVTLFERLVSDSVMLE